MMRLILILLVAALCGGCMTVPVVIGTRNHVIINGKGSVETANDASGGSKGTATLPVGP